MRVRINGEEREVPNGLDLQSLLQHLDMPQQRVAVELDRQVIRKADWQTTVVKSGAELEIVHFVGGG